MGSRLANGTCALNFNSPEAMESRPTSLTIELSSTLSPVDQGFVIARPWSPSNKKGNLW